MNILIVDDDADSALVLKSVLNKNGFPAAVAKDGPSALTHLQTGGFDVLVTDWMMPEMDGIELIRKVRKTISPIPLIVMITVITTPEAREHALISGADDCMVKPYVPLDMVKLLQDLRARQSQLQPVVTPVSAPAPPQLPSYIGVALATSTGGPAALGVVLKAFPPEMKSQAAVFIVMHGPIWMIETMPDYLRGHTQMTVKLAAHRLQSEVGHIYIAPGDTHLEITAGTAIQRLTKDEKQNFVRPSADPLFRSVAASFGKYSVAAVLTGMGRDGTKGAADIFNAGGVVIGQNPKTAIAPSMPETLIQAGLAMKVAPLWNLGAVIGREVLKRSEELSGLRKA